MIELKNISKSFQNSHILQDINLQIKRGEFILLEGVSGSGKTSLLHLIASFMKPSSGEVIVDDENIATFSDVHAAEYRAVKIGYVTQLFYLFENLSVSENLYSALLVKNYTSHEAKKRIEKVLGEVNLLAKKEQKVATLSGGEKQRVVIARALINDAKILICDEPTANLDSANAQKFLALIEQLKNENRTIIVATHDPIFRELSCVERIIKMKDGKLV